MGCALFQKSCWVRQRSTIDMHATYHCLYRPPPKLPPKPPPKSPPLMPLPLLGGDWVGCCCWRCAPLSGVLKLAAPSSGAPGAFSASRSEGPDWLAERATRRGGRPVGRATRREGDPSEGRPVGRATYIGRAPIGRRPIGRDLFRRELK